MPHNSLIAVKYGICVVCKNYGPYQAKKTCPNCYMQGIKIKSYNKQLAKIKIEEPKEDSAELERWFHERRLEMVGFCANCNAVSCKKSDQFFKCSIAHILPKAYFPSIATHEDNWIELCFWGDKSCHSNMDNKILDLSEMNCWDEIVEKFITFYPTIAKKERRRIPNILMQYINTDV
jgi:hypothetical protein